MLAGPDDREAGMGRLDTSTANQIIEAGRRLVAAGFVDGTTGNVSARDGARLLITPTSRDYRLLRSVDLVHIDLTSEETEGSWRPSSEWRMHAGVYRVREDVQAIVHHHAIWSSAVSVARLTIPVLIDEAADIGPIPTAEYAPSASPELARVVSETIAQGHNAILLANHGAVAVGRSVAEALRRALEVERISQMFICAAILGGAHPLDAMAITRSREFFKGYRADHHVLVPTLRSGELMPEHARLNDVVSYAFRAGIEFISLLQSLVLGRLSHHA